MFERMTDRARKVIVLSMEEARLLNHAHIGTEHLLLGLISEGELKHFQRNFLSFFVLATDSREFLSHTPVRMMGMETTLIKESIKWLEKSNADLEPGLLSADAARALLDDYARAEKLASYVKTMLADRNADA